MAAAPNLPNASGTPPAGPIMALAAPMQSVPNPPHEQAPQTSTDFWDISSSTYSGALPAGQGFDDISRIGQAPAQSQLQKSLSSILLLLVFFTFSYAAYEYFVNDVDVLEVVSHNLTTLISGETEAPPELPIIAEPVVKKKPAAKPVAAVPKPTPPKIDVVAGNPYWHLPNSLDDNSQNAEGSLAPLGRPWTPEEEEAWRAGMAHRFVYQHYKTVQDIRQKRLLGSEVILWDAMQDRKFWTRMFAVVGLAEFKMEVPIERMEEALGRERSELIANFFERFVKRSNEGQRYIMRQAIRLLDERGRLVVLRALTRSNDDLRNLYLVAATQDPSAKVQKWAEANLAHLNIDVAEHERLMQVVSGEITLEMPAALETPVEAPAEAGAAPVDAKVALENDFEDFEDSIGDVELYDDDLVEPAASGEVDTQTFDLRK